MTAFATSPANPFAQLVAKATGAPLCAEDIGTIQVNVGLRCNLACQHCHVESGPKRSEEMNWTTMEQVLAAAKAAGSKILDVTGGAPEMNPHFRRFVSAARRQGLHVLVRTNLTIMLAEGYTGLPEFFRIQRVHLVASLPCYLEKNVDKQRGKQVHAESVKVLRKLNAIGYGIEPHLPLDLVYNPGGATLPPEQGPLEATYRRELGKRFGIRFTRLIAIANMPIGRFLHDLEREGKAAGYEKLLEEHFNPATIAPLMCRHQVSVRWDGMLFDCDFNLAMGLKLAPQAATRHISEFDTASLRARPIATARHCLGCAAGNGSSCGGALL